GSSSSGSSGSSSSGSSSGSSSSGSSSGGGGTTYYLTPGVYVGGLKYSGQDSVVMAPGLYYMEGGGFSFSGQGSLTGSGVMIYNAPGHGNSGGISVTGQGAINLSGMTSGIYQGITFFQERNSTVTGNVSGTGGGTNLTGTF